MRAGLEARGHRLTTQGDVETLVHLYEEHGVEMLRFLRGMFAFALWDSRKQTLFLARDRLGKKPLNYAVADDTLYFCSELAPLLDQKLARMGDRSGRARRVSPIRIRLRAENHGAADQKTAARALPRLARGEFELSATGPLRSAEAESSYEEARTEVRAKLDESLRLRLRSDVPLGLLLSGGLDSNALLARLVRGLGEKVQAFTIGFAEKEYDESDIARASAKHFGVEHHVLQGSTDLLKLLPDVVRHYGEPSADKSALPTMLVSELTRQHVKVALSGDGGDEAFAGYPKHRLHSWQHYSSALFPQEFRKHWTLASMRGEGWLGGKAMGKLRRQLLAETPSLFSGEFFSGPFYERITTSALRRQSDDFLRGMSPIFGTARWNRSSASCSGTTRSRCLLHC